MPETCTPDAPTYSLSAPPIEGLLGAMSAVFEALGRGLVCLDSGFHVLHASEGIQSLLGEGAARALTGKRAEAVFGEVLFGPEGSMRRALLHGERREGWSATMSVPGGERTQVSLSAAPLDRSRIPGCDPRVAHLLVVRAAEEDSEAGSAAPTVFSGIVARSAVMLRIFSLVDHLKESDATILLTGESGTGKELFARALHLHSPRHTGPFVAVNCGALPGELLESELFGHVRGAFTGAVRDRMGRFELASGGTIFLDEVGDLPLPLQVKLLRVLQERTFERVGESRSRPTSARIIAATHVDLRRAAHEGRFRDDLYYRLRVVPIDIPPLRERREDIEPLARTLLARINARYGRALRLDSGVFRALLAHPWPGNVRELENALEYAVAVCRGQTIHAQDLPSEVWASLGGGEAHPPVSLGPVHDPPTDPERERLLAALAAHHWRRDEAARALGVSRTTLWRKMRELKLDA